MADKVWNLTADELATLYLASWGLMPGAIQLGGLELEELFSNPVLMLAAIFAVIIALYKIGAALLRKKR